MGHFMQIVKMTFIGSLNPAFSVVTELDETNILLYDLLKET